MQGLGIAKGTGAEQHPLGRRSSQCAGRIERFPLKAVLVGPHQQAGGFGCHWRRRAAGGELGGPDLDPRGLLFLALDRAERGTQGIGRRRSIATTPLAVEVDRRCMQAKQQAGRLDRRWRMTVVVAGKRCEVELVLRGALPEEVEVDALGGTVRALHQIGGRRLGKAQHHGSGLDLGALAAGGFDLQARTCVGKHRAGLECAVFLKQDVGACHEAMPEPRPTPPSIRL